MTRIVLEISQLNHSYGKQAILRDITLRIQEGKIACLLGPSGCGKTTLLRCIAGFECIDSGHIILNQQLVSSCNQYIPPEKRRVGVVFQDYALFPHMTVEKNIEFGIQHLSKLQRREKVQNLLRSIELENVSHRYPGELSGGQQQRIALARALAPGPELLLLDEPFSHLDPNLRDKMKNELKHLLRHFGVTALIVTHDQDEAFDMADEVAVMVDGRIAQWGSAYELYHKPANRVVAEFLGTSAFLPVVVNERGNLQTELGIIDVNSKLSELQDKKLTLMLRPDDIVHDDEGKLKAVVKGVAFRGTYRLYHLILPSGLEIHSLTSSHHELHEIGSFIGIRLDIKHAVISYDDRVIIEEKPGA